VLSIAYLGLIIFIFIFELSRKKDTKFDFLSLFHLFFILLYPLPGFFITSLAGNYEIFDPHIILLSVYDIQYTIQVPIAIFITYFLVVFGYYSPSALKYGSIVNITPRSNIIFWIITTGILFLGLFSISIYTAQYGGLSQAIADANFIRSGAVKGQALGFFIRLVYFNFFAAYLIASWLFIKKNQRRNLILWLLFALAMSSSLVSAFLVSARATMILALSNFYLAYILYRKKFALFILIPVLIAVVLFIVYGKILFYSLSGFSEGGYIEFISRFKQASGESNEEGSFITSLVKVFSYGFTSLYAASQEYYPIRLLSDWIYGIGSFLPDHLMKVNVPDTVSTNNTKYLVGDTDYEIPAGFIASCIYSWSWVGVVIFSFTYGWLGRYLQTILYRHLYKIFWFPFLYVAIAQAWSDFFASGDPRIFLQANFCVLVSLLFLLVFGVKISTSRGDKELRSEMSS
jgi:hypothetical protein